MGTTSIKKIGEHLDKLGWHYQMDEKRGMILSGASGANGTYVVLIALQQNDTLIVVIPFAKALAGANLPESRVAALDELLLDLNYRLAVGAFERSSKDGEIRFRVGFPTEDGGPSRDQLRHLLMACCMSVDRHSPEILGLIHGENAPKPHPSGEMKF